MKPLFAIALAISATACVPGIYDYYKPSATGGNAINDSCGSIAPKSSMQFRPEGIDVRVTGSNSFIFLQLRIPEGITVKLESIKIHTTNGEIEHSVPLESFRYTNIEERKDYSVPATNELRGKNDTFLFGNVEPRIYSTDVELTNEMGQSFSVQLPAIKVNGTLHTFPSIQFNKSKGFGIHPINC